jgi:hypothetical protein
MTAKIETAISSVENGNGSNGFSAGINCAFQQIQSAKNTMQMSRNVMLPKILVIKTANLSVVVFVKLSDEYN